MIAVARHRDRLLVANLMQRYNPVSDAVGQLVQVAGAGRAPARLLRELCLRREPGARHWFWDRSKSGGIFVEHGVHFFDLFAGWLGPGRVVAAQVGRAARLVAADRGARPVHGALRRDGAGQLLPRLPPGRPDGPPGAAAGLRAGRRDALRLGADPGPSPRDRRRGPDPSPLRALPRRTARCHGDLRTARTEPARAVTRPSTSTRCWSSPGATAQTSRNATASCSVPLLADQLAWVRDHSHRRKSPRQTAAIPWPSPARPTRWPGPIILTRARSMPSRNDFRRVLLRPSRPRAVARRLRGGRRLQSGGVGSRMKVILLVRVAERPREERPGFTALPRWSNHGDARIDWVP